MEENKQEETTEEVKIEEVVEPEEKHEEPTFKVCPNCEGEGTESKDTPCRECKGTGEVNI